MRKHYFLRLFILCTLLFLVGSCGPQRRITIPDNRIYDNGPIVWEAPSKPLPAPKQPIVKKEKLETIVIDAGHGGKDTGALSEKNHYEEKQLTLVTARLIQKYLEEMGYETVLTRDGDNFIELSNRALLANSLKADLFVSIHYNFCETPDVEGIEVYYYKDQKNPSAQRLVASRHLGEEVLSRIVKHTGAQSRGIKTANFAVIRETTMPAILVEGGFLSHPGERERIKDHDYRCYLAWGIARGVDSYLEKNRK